MDCGGRAPFPRRGAAASSAHRPRGYPAVTTGHRQRSPPSGNLWLRARVAAHCLSRRYQAIGARATRCIPKPADRACDGDWLGRRARHRSRRSQRRRRPFRFASSADGQVGCIPHSARTPYAQRPGAGLPLDRGCSSCCTTSHSVNPRGARASTLPAAPPASAAPAPGWPGPPSPA